MTDVIWQSQSCMKATCARGRERIPGWRRSRPLPGACSLWVFDLCWAAGDGAGGDRETPKESAKPSARDLEHVFQQEGWGMRDSAWTCWEHGHGPAFWGSWLMTSVLQTAVYSLAGKRPAGSWAAWKRPPGSSRGKSAFEKTMNTSVGLPSSGPSGWCLQPTASTSEPHTPRSHLPSHSGSATFPGSTEPCGALFFSFPSFFFVVESECVLIIFIFKIMVKFT